MREETGAVTRTSSTTDQKNLLHIIFSSALFRTFRSGASQYNSSWKKCTNVVEKEQRRKLT
ncbi:hypothetical protein INR49_025339, partial [Caranx melampygus]